MTSLPIITQSALRTFRKCPRLYEQYYQQLFRPIHVAEPLKYGTVWHNIREAWWKAVGGRLGFSLETFHKIYNVNHEDYDPFIAAKLAMMLIGYHTRWSQYIDSVEILGVEMPFHMSIVNPRTGKESRTFVLEGKLDAVIRDQGKLWVVEEKTAGQDLPPEAPYWRRLEIDPQCSVYYDAVKKMFGEEPAGVKYFVNVKPQIKPAKKTENIKYKKDGSGPYANQRLEDETPEQYRQRLEELIIKDPERFYHLVEVPRLDKDIYASQMDIWDTAKSIRAAEVSGVWLRNPDNCISIIGQTCSFLPVCTNRASLEDTMLYRKAETAHEELVNE